MKTVLLFVLTLFAAASVHAQSAFGVLSTAVSTNTYYCVVPPSGATCANLISASCDNGTGVLTFYSGPSAGIQITNAAGATASNILVESTSTLVNNDVVIIRKVATDQYLKAIVQVTNSNAGGFIITNTATAASLPWAVSAGDMVYKMTAGPAFKVANTVLTLSSPAVLVQRGEVPALVELAVSGSTTNNGVVVAGQRHVP